MKGFNSYSSGKSTIEDNEIPYGLNMFLDNTGSASKRLGRTKFGTQISAGHAIYGMGILNNTTYNKLIVASNTSWYSNDGTNSSALTGVTFTADKYTHFCQAVDRLYGANNTNQLAYTADGSTITEQTSNGNIGDWPVFYNQRLYMTNAQYPDRIYYSNPYSLDLGANPPVPAYTYFGTFDTSLVARTKDTDPVNADNKNAGFIILNPGGGVKITRLFKDSQAGQEYVYAYTKNHGIWRVTFNSVLLDGSLAHNISQLVSSGGCPAGSSIIKVANDQWSYTRDNFNTLGEQATYQNVRISPKGSRVQNEILTIPPEGRANVAAGFFNSKIYFAYQTGDYNDRYLMYSIPLNAWSTPLTGNFSQFIEWEDTTGAVHFLGGSSNSADSYVYKLESGLSDDTTAINGYFEHKSTDCGLAGQIKRFAFIKVFYTAIFGAITYQVFIDESNPITDTIQVGNSTTYPVGIGTQVIGTFLIGKEYNPNTTFAYVSLNSDFTIDCGYAPGKKISVRFTNNNINESMTIDGDKIFYLEGDIYESNQ